MRQLLIICYAFLFMSTAFANTQTHKGMQYPSLSPDGSELAFSMHGDIWKVSANGGKAVQVTFHSSDDLKPRWSPDGKWLAFNSNRSGNFDIWVIPSAGGKAQQVTFHSAWDSIGNWSASGRSIFFSSYRSGNLEVWNIPYTGGYAIPMTTDSGRDPQISNDQQRFVYTRGSASLWIKGYQGAANWDIYQKFLSPQSVPERLTASEANDLHPFYSNDGKLIYFLRESKRVIHSQEKWIFDLWQMDIAGKNAKSLTSFEEDIVNPCPSFDGKMMAFEMDFQLHIYNLETKKLTPVVITIPPRNMVTTQSKVISDGNEMGHISPDGKTIAFVLQGNIWTIPSQGGEAKVLVSGKAKYQWPRFSPDGKSLAYFSNKSGNEDIYILNLSTQKEEQITKHAGDDFFHSWSPDSKSLVFTSSRSGNRDIWKMDLATKAVVQMTNSPESEDDAVVSPDGKWLAFDSGKTGHQEIWVMPIDGKFSEAIQLSNHQVLSQVPTWSPDSRWIAYEKNDNDGKVSIWFVAREGGKPVRVVENASLPFWSGDGKHIFFESDRTGIKNLYRIAAPVDIIVEERIPFFARVEIDTQKERAKVFDEAWRAIHRGFYDAKFHGVDWQKMREKYEPLALQATTDIEFNQIVTRMVGELGASHLGISGPEKSPSSSTKTGYFGWDIRMLSNNRVFQVVDVVRGGPADQVWIRKGDFIFQIGEELVTEKMNLASLLNNKVDQKIKIFVSPTLDPNDGRYIDVKPTTASMVAAYRYHEKIRNRLRLVKQKVGSEVVYIHLNEMNLANLKNFRQIVKDNAQARAMIIDVRDNGGGLIHEELLEILTRRPFLKYKVRGDEKMSVQPNIYWDKPVVVLINSNSFSDAEVFAHAFQSLKRGLVIGEPTSGGVIGTRDIKLSNDATFRVPRVGYFGLDGKNLEGEGVQPDILVLETPESRAKQNDVQLLKALEILQQQLKGK